MKTKSKIRIGNLNARAVVFNAATVAGDTVYYPARIVGCVSVERKHGGTPGIDGNNVSGVSDSYFDSVNSAAVGKAFVLPKDWTPSARMTSWTLRPQDLIWIGDGSSFSDIYTFTENQISDELIIEDILANDQVIIDALAGATAAEYPVLTNDPITAADMMALREKEKDTLKSISICNMIFGKDGSYNISEIGSI